MITLNAEMFEYDENSGIYEVIGASQTVKAGDKVLLSDGENFALIAVAAVSRGSTLTITAAEDDISLDDFYQFLKVDQDVVSSVQEEDKVSLSSGPDLLRGQIRKAKNGAPSDKTIKLKLDNIDIDFLSYSVDGAISGEIGAKLLIQRDVKGLGKKYFRCEFTYTADMDAELSVEDKPNAGNGWEEKELSLGKVAIPFGVLGLNAFAEIRARVALQTEGGMELQGGFKTTQGFRYSSKDGYQVIDQKRSYWTMSCEGFGEVEFGPMPIVGVEYLNGAFSCELDSFIGVRAEGTVTEPEHTGDTIHACNRCAEGTLYSVCSTDAVMEYDIFGSLSGRPIDENIVYSEEYLSDFFVSLDNDPNSMFGGKVKFGMGECPNWITNTVATEPAPTEAPTAPSATQPPTEAPTETPIFQSGTIDFGNSVNRVSWSTEQQVWKQDGITLVHVKAANSADISSFIDPIRLYPRSQLTISAPGMQTIDFVCYNEDYISALVNSIPSSDTYSVSCDKNIVTVAFKNPVDSFQIENLSKQVRLKSITVQANLVIPPVSERPVSGPYSLSYNYKSSQAGYFVNNIGYCTDTAVEIASFYNGLPVIGIGASVFEGCDFLTSITIPDSVTSIGIYAFKGCSSLTSVTIPDGVTIIGNEAFRGCSALTSITIPNRVTTISNSAFRDCSSLTSITIPNSVTSIEGGPFFGCSLLTSIRFDGTVAQWDGITKHVYWNSGTGNYTVYCTDGQIAKDGTVTYK